MKIISETRRTFHPLDIPANSRIDRSFDLSVMNSVLWQLKSEKLIDIPSQLQQLKLLLARNTLNLMAICLTIIIAFINLYFIYKSSFMNENPFSRISNPLSPGFTRRRGRTLVINFLVHPGSESTFLLHLHLTEKGVSLLLIMNS